MTAARIRILLNARDGRPIRQREGAPPVAKTAGHFAKIVRELRDGGLIVLEKGRYSITPAGLEAIKAHETKLSKPSITLLARLGEGTEIVARSNVVARRLTDLGFADWLPRIHPSSALGYLTITAAGSARLENETE